MGMAAEELTYTFAEFLKWDEHKRYELLEGEPVMMAAPLRIHQLVSGALFARFYNFLEGKKCQIYAAPFAVRLFEKEGDRPRDVDTVLEPDLVVVCDAKKLDSYGCKGAPDLVVEILSPSSRRYDQIIKLELYRKAGVREYWIVSPEEQTVRVFLLEDGVYALREVYERTDIAKVHVLDGCFIELSRVFPKETA